jgi:hypothetical protein
MSLDDKLLDLLVQEGRKYRRIFLRANGAGPWECFECHKPVVFKTLCVHHIDNDRDNNKVENLVAIHRPCHQRLHYREDQKQDMDKLRDIRWAKPGARTIYSKTIKDRAFKVSCVRCRRELVYWNIDRHQAVHGIPL